MEKTKKIAKVPFKEYIWYIIACVLTAWGIGQIICGLILEFSNVKLSDMPLYNAQLKYIELFGLSFMHWGLILMGIGVLIGVVTLCICAGRYDRESEKASRRAARLAQQKELIEKVSIVDAEVK